MREMFFGSEINETEVKQLQAALSSKILHDYFLFITKNGREVPKFF